MRKVRPALLRQMNERAVFQYIRGHGPVTRADLTRKLGMSAPAASRAVANLIRAGLIEAAAPQRKAGAGRPGTWYSLAGAGRRVLGATVGLERCTVVSAGIDGVVEESSAVSFRTPHAYTALLDELVRAAHELTGNAKTLGLGISVPGQIDRRSGTVMMSPNLHLLDGRSLGADLEKRLKMRCIMFHETDCACMAEQSFGAARGMSDFALVSLYEGLGVSAVVSGRLLTGHNGLAGEIGHCTVLPDGRRCGCGNVGCLETVATDAAFAAAISRRTGRTMPIDEIVRRAREGSLNVDRELDRTLAYLAIGLGVVINALNPQSLLLCGRMLDLVDMNDLRQRVARHALKPLLVDCSIVRAEGSTIKGAIACIIEHIADSVGPEMQR